MDLKANINLHLLKAKCLILEGKSKESEQIFHKIDDKLKKIDDPKLQAKVDCEHAVNLLYLGEPDLAIQKAHKSLKFFKQMGDVEHIAKCNLIFGTIYYSRGKYDEALKYYERGRDGLQSRHDNSYLRALGNIANIYNAHGKLIKSVQMMKEAIELALKLKNLRVYSILCLNLSETYLLLGDFEKSLQYLEKGAETAQKTHNDFMVALSLIEKTRYWAELGEIKKAQKLLIADAAPIIKKLSHPHIQLIYDLINIELALKQGEFIDAYSIAKKSIQYTQKSGRNTNRIELYTKYAEIAHSFNHVEEAYKFLKKANREAMETKSDVDRTLVLMTRGKLNLMTFNLNEAEIQLEEALWLSKNTKVLEMEYKILLLLVRVYLYKYHKEPSAQIMKKIENTLKASLGMAEEHSLLPCKVQSLILLGIFRLVQQKFQNAQENLENALKISKTKGMKEDEKLASDLLNVLTLSQPSIIEKSPDQHPDAAFTYSSSIMENLIKNQKFVQTILEDVIDKETLALQQKRVQEDDIQKIFIVTYRIDEKIGPLIHKCTKNYHEDSKWDNILSNIASIFYLAVGQGSIYNQGLYGPFPVVEENLRALVYACFMKDSDMKDIRLKKRNYYLFTLIFPQNLSQYFYNQQNLTQIFDSFLQKFNDIRHINEKNLIDLHYSIIQQIIRKETHFIHK